MAAAHADLEAKQVCGFRLSRKVFVQIRKDEGTIAGYGVLHWIAHLFRLADVLSTLAGFKRDFGLCL